MSFLLQIRHEASKWTVSATACPDPTKGPEEMGMSCSHAWAQLSDPPHKDGGVTGARERALLSHCPDTEVVLLISTPKPSQAARSVGAGPSPHSGHSQQSPVSGAAGGA